MVPTSSPYGRLYDKGQQVRLTSLSDYSKSFVMQVFIFEVSGVRTEHFIIGSGNNLISINLEVRKNCAGKPDITPINVVCIACRIMTHFVGTHVPEVVGQRVRSQQLKHHTVVFVVGKCILSGRNVKRYLYQDWFRTKNQEKDEILLQVYDC